MYKKIKYPIKVSLTGSLLITLLFLGLSGCSKSSSGEDEQQPQTDAKLVSIAVKTAPAKTGYFIDEEFSSAGLVVEGKYDDGTSAPIAQNQLIISGFNSAAPVSRQDITITYNGLSAIIPVEIYPFKAQNGNEITGYVENATSVTIPSGVTKIAEDAFIGKSMESVTFPETLQEIGNYAFFSCKKLKSVTLPASLTTVGEGVFDNCGALTAADLSKTRITAVAGYMFNRCPVLSDVKLPANATSIGGLAFNEAVSLRTVILPATLRFIGLDAFRDSGLEQINLPNNIKQIRQRAFLSCQSLTEVTTFGTYTPAEDGFISVLESSAFQDVPALTKFEIPAGIVKLEQSIISNCPLLREVTIPASVNLITFAAFGNTQIVQATILAETPPSPGSITSNTSWQAFPSTTTAIKVPAGAVDAYKQAPGWSAYSNIISAQ